VGHAGVALDGVGPEQEDLRDDRGLAQSPNRGGSPACLSPWHQVLARNWAGEVRNVSLLGCDRRERARHRDHSRHL